METPDLQRAKIDFVQAALNEQRHVAMPANPPSQHFVHFVKQTCLEHHKIIRPTP